MYFIFPISYLAIAIVMIIILAAGIGVALYKVFYVIMWLTIAFIAIFSIIMHIKSFISDNSGLHKSATFVINLAISIGEGILVYYWFSEMIEYFSHGHLISALEGLVDLFLGLPFCGVILLVGSIIIALVSIDSSKPL